ncbi:MAG: DUF3486 family protein [Alphaproteobacteria bacterium]|nr:DUF3486 family protein [Alphaproteobacteria bacterium]
MGKRGPKSSLTTLPHDVKAQVDQMLNSGVTIRELVSYLREAGEERSHGAVQRFTAQERAIRKRLHQSREMAARVVSELGSAAAQGKQGRLLVELVQNLTNEYMRNIYDGAEMTPDDIQKLARGIKEMAIALRHSQDFEDRDAVMAKAAAAAASIIKDRAEGGGANAIENGEDLLAAIRSAMEDG